MNPGRLLIPLLLLPGCVGGDAPVRTADSRPAAPSDSLVLTAPGGVEVWLTLARTATSAEGASCLERTLEIRRGETRTRVPLLYTATTPELVNDTTLRARLSNHCVPGDAYLVDLGTGRPVRER